jgi:hypothetical protein
VSLLSRQEKYSGNIDVKKSAFDIWNTAYPYSLGAAVAMISVYLFVLLCEWTVQPPRIGPIDWDAIAAIGTVSAVALALREAGRASRAQRSRDAAKIEAILMMLESGSLIIKRQRNRVEQGEDVRVIGRLLLETDGFSQLGRAFDGVSLLDLPHPKVVDAVFSGRVSVTFAINILQQWRDAGSREPLKDMDVLTSAFEKPIPKLQSLLDEYGQKFRKNRDAPEQSRDAI